MKKKFLILCFFCVSAFTIFGGCGQQDQGEMTEAIDTEGEMDIGDICDVDADIKNMNEWEGTWRSFAEYCNDKEMKGAWEEIAEAFDLDVEQLKDTFDSLCFITDDVVKFKIKDGVVTAYDTTNEEVFSREYNLAGVFESDSDETVIEGEKSYLFETNDEDAGNFKYLCMMPICSLENTDNGLELADHFHFNYGSTMEKATNRSGIPSMVDDDITNEEKLQTLCGFFQGSKNEE